jgi:uncharacterized protein (TIGR02996 family)
VSDEKQFLKAIRAKPEDRTARLVYADWLDEHDKAGRAELIRVEEEIRTTPIYSDRYWELKPRRRALLRSVKGPWLDQMGYGGTDYQPVFADVPTGWTERWRLLREFTERWYQIPVGDVGGPLKPLPRPRGRPSLEEEAGRTVDDAMSDAKVRAGLPPALREWVFFIRDLRLGLKGFGRGSGDRHLLDPGERIRFLFRDGGRDWCFVRAEHRRQPDPPVWWDSVASDPNDYSQLVAPHVTTLALQYLLTQYEPEFGEQPGAQKTAKPFARRLASYFPVRSDFDGTLIFERPNVIVLWMPQSLFTEEGPHLHVKVRPPANPDEVYDQLWA